MQLTELITDSRLRMNEIQSTIREISLQVNLTFNPDKKHTV